MKFGLSADDYKLLLELLAKPINEAYPKAKLWVFGSRAKGTHKKYSDIDILIESSAPLSQTFLSELRDRLEESSLPYKVDLVPIQDLPQAYAKEVLATRKPLS